MITPEIHQVLTAIEEAPQYKPEGTPFAESRMELLLILSGITSLAGAVLLFFFEPMRIWGLILGGVFLFLFLLYTLVQVGSTYGIFSDPLENYASRAENRLWLRTAHINNLSQFSPESLHIVRQVLERDERRMRASIYSLLGAIDKAGIIPAGLALYFAAANLGQGTTSINAYILAAFIMGLYIGAFIINRVVESLKFQMECVEEVCSIASQRAMSDGQIAQCLCDLGKIRT